jgi:hypothetical protein
MTRPAVARRERMTLLATAHSFRRWWRQGQPDSGSVGKSEWMDTWLNVPSLVWAE